MNISTTYIPFFKTDIYHQYIPFFILVYTSSILYQFLKLVRDSNWPNGFLGEVNVVIAQLIFNIKINQKLIPN